jgi:hypothetical protein
MRFSLRWLLLATAYVALVAAALRIGTVEFAHSVWVVSFLALCYAVVIACNPKSRRQAAAIGFVTLATIHIACLLIDPDTPVSRIVYLVTGQRSTELSIVNGAFVLVAGLIGCGVGALAYRHSKDQ